MGLVVLECLEDNPGVVGISSTCGEGPEPWWHLWFRMSRGDVSSRCWQCFGSRCHLVMTQWSVGVTVTQPSCWGALTVLSVDCVGNTGCLPPSPAWGVLILLEIPVKVHLPPALNIL